LEEICDTFKEVNERVIALTDSTSCLIDPDMSRIQWLKVKGIYTARRTSTPTKIAFAGGNGI
jgi:hypothetical protein